MVKLVQPAPPILLLVVVRKLPRLSTVLQPHPLEKRGFHELQFEMVTLCDGY